MKAMIFAAGLGTRLRPLTDTVPKALVEVGGEPMLGRLLRKIHDSGIDKAVVNVHHHAQKVIDFLSGIDYMDIDISDESDCLLDTGGGLLRALPLLNGEDDVLIHNADILTDIDFTSMIGEHRYSGADVTLLVAHRPSTRNLLFDESGRMRGWRNVSTGMVLPQGLDAGGFIPYSFGGVHVVSRRFLTHLADRATPGVPFSIVQFYVECCESMKIRGFEQPADSYWFDIGKPDSLSAAREFVDSGFGG